MSSACATDDFVATNHLSQTLDLSKVHGPTSLSYSVPIPPTEASLSSTKPSSSSSSVFLPQFLKNLFFLSGGAFIGMAIACTLLSFFINEVPSKQLSLFNSLASSLLLIFLSGTVLVVKANGSTTYRLAVLFAAISLVLRTLWSISNDFVFLFFYSLFSVGFCFASFMCFGG
ncbi:hypothetical protein P9112_004127 [Eukaryota sp. TZLM1-RC]